MIPEGKYHAVVATWALHLYLLGTENGWPPDPDRDWRLAKELLRISDTEVYSLACRLLSARCVVPREDRLFVLEPVVGDDTWCEAIGYLIMVPNYRPKGLPV